MSSVLEIKDLESFSKVVKDNGSGLSVVHFSASWAPQCGQMDSVMTELGKDPQMSSVKFCKLEAEDIPELSEKFEVTAVPTFILIKGGQKVDRVDGANAAELTKKVKAQASITSLPQPPKPKTEDLQSRLKRLTNAADVMLFMKGNSEEPKCGFSRQITQILKENNVHYSSFNILEDEEVRQGLKTFSNWPTFPQLYSKGELLGGLDIVKELAESGELKSQLPQQQSLDDRLKGLIKEAPVMLFMKGDKAGPRCGFSKQIVSLLNDAKISYSTFDILTDDEVRQGLKKFSNWPTYPQLYVNGELIGGLDIIKELQESGELTSILQDGQ